MTGKSHLITGACALAQLYAANSFLAAHGLSLPISLSGDLGAGQVFPAAVHMAAFFFGTLFPDIDTKKSILGRVLHVPIRHRTWLHAAYLYIGCLASSLLYPVFGWFAFGAFVHLFWDSFSPMGICWFYKLASDYREYPGGARVKKGFHITLYRSGEWTEYLVVFLLVAVSVAVVILTGKI